MHPWKELMIGSALVLASYQISHSMCENNVIDLRPAGIPVYVGSVQSGQVREVNRLLKYALKDNGSLLALLPKVAGAYGNVTKDCQEDIDILKNSREILELYLDASSKIPNGILEGNFNWLGAFHECLNIPSVINNGTGMSFKGEYFTSALYLNNKPVFGPYPILLGLCFPDSCSPQDVTTQANMLMQYIKNETFLDLKINYTVSDKSADLDSGAVAVVSVTGALFLIMLLTTIIDYYLSMSMEDQQIITDVVEEDATSYSDSSDRSGLLSREIFSRNIQDEQCKNLRKKILHVCKVFSLVSNAKKLLGSETAIGPLACLNGLRVISMWWVILGHTYAFAINVSDNLGEAADFIKRFTFQPIVNGTYSVDSFFFLSGLLVAYLTLKEIREKGKLNWAYYFLHRYWRLTPLLAYIILYYTFLFVPSVSGPLRFFVTSPEFQETVDVCKSHWWTNLLYINNMYPNSGSLGKTCVAWTWYLANDMQFYIFLGPLVILTLSLPRRKKYVGIILACILIAAGVAIRGSLVWYYGIKDAMNETPTKHTDDPLAQNGPLYGRPYARYSVYLVGMLTGYILSSSQNRVNIPRLAALFGWCVAIATALSVVYGQYHFFHDSTTMNQTQSAFYLAFGRTAWGLCLSWVVLACVSGNGGPVKDILSWKIWAPLGRLTYAAYLVHPIVIFTYYYNMRQVLHIYDLNMIYLFISNLVMSYLIAFIVSMLIEAPLIQLEKSFRSMWQLYGRKVHLNTG